ncbi:ActS/PrrB/RegB family redox-sensitive histidine kinase [uncultured Bartonella sp.]|uniref:ActS/PrrB/RegB family redox-sensitive histidine kinase n=1 Tax=uncultured Bartonella sp. TaxID=104108 RepID=UPI00263258C9|nr:ActS/PrrB/RegB family redox-sensitive histidine kinase [uncultured Bartonella sp.]
MEKEFIQRTSTYSRRLRSTTLVRIRWLAIFCQTMTIVFVSVYLGFKVPIIPCAILIGLSIWLNVFLTFYYSINDRLSSTVATAILGIDVLQYAALLYLTGGLQNPFSLLLIAPAVISATSLPGKHIIFLNFLVIILASILSTYSEPLPWYPGRMIETPRLLVDGIWTAIVSSLLFITTYGYRVAEETRSLADALNATELVLQHEKHLSELDGLAAAAAHELGTPLATIQLVVKEMYNGLKNDPVVGDDLNLLLSQTERCRNILKRLTTLSSEGEEHLSHLTLLELLEEVSEPLREFGIDIITQKDETSGEEPIFPRNPGILYGLGNLLENAVDFARSKIIIRYKWNEKYVALTIIDDGHGYDPSILDRIGEPYTTSRHADSQGGGLGLGLFIAKTLLERSGALLRFRNSPKKEFGAEVYLAWSRKSLNNDKQI